MGMTSARSGWACQPVAELRVSEQRLSSASSLSAFARFPILLRPTSDATPSTIVNRINIPLVKTSFLPMGICVFILLFSLLEAIDSHESRDGTEVDHERSDKCLFDY
jgi:hypothetical protein